VQRHLDAPLAAGRLRLDRRAVVAVGLQAMLRRARDLERGGLGRRVGRERLLGGLPGLSARVVAAPGEGDERAGLDLQHEVDAAFPRLRQRVDARRAVALARQALAHAIRRLLALEPAVAAPRLELRRLAQLGLGHRQLALETQRGQALDLARRATDALAAVPEIEREAVRALERVGVVLLGDGAEAEAPAARG
jgi:hypothetical protein